MKAKSGTELPGEKPSPFVELLMATGASPEGRIRGWVAAKATGGADNVPLPALIERYGAAVRRECHAAGFEPAFITPLRQQSREAQTAAVCWAAATTAAGTY